ncbi:uncharacterized protein LOC132537578 [Erinaceus europaeus]|uniref:Uncharacterized protein LOC132537578 n=1 Tax=Erinaceus europaeus TaxID=9365 RepID=A0ABM3X6E0_ERIEU|nr:uncharacterized protein LOC132537578 [Erinaceus europaeus]
MVNCTLCELCLNKYIYTPKKSTYVTLFDPVPGRGRKPSCVSEAARCGWARGCGPLAGGAARGRSAPHPIRTPRRSRGFGCVCFNSPGARGESRRRGRAGRGVWAPDAGPRPREEGAGKAKGSPGPSARSCRRPRAGFTGRGCRSQQGCRSTSARLAVPSARGSTFPSPGAIRSARDHGAGRRRRGRGLGGCQQRRVAARPSIAQLVERRTVVGQPWQSLGRWFDSGSKDFVRFFFFFLPLLCDHPPDGVGFPGPRYGCSWLVGGVGGQSCGAETGSGFGTGCVTITPGRDGRPAQNSAGPRPAPAPLPAPSVAGRALQPVRRREGRQPSRGISSNGRALA